MALLQEKVTLPSNGLIYGEGFNPHLTIRSMTTEDEIKRLAPNNGVAEYETIAEVIDDCLVTKCPISAYDLCLGDFNFLMTKLKIVSYGNEHKILINCPNCKQVTVATADLDSLETVELTQESYEKLERVIELPISKHKITLAFQTPRMIDDIKIKANEKRNKTKKNLGYEVLYSTMSLIQEIDDKPVNPIQLEDFVKKLPVADTNYIIKKGDELNGKVGLGRTIIAKCDSCNYETVTNFLIEPSLLGPENY